MAEGNGLCCRDGTLKALGGAEGGPKDGTPAIESFRGPGDLRSRTAAQISLLPPFSPTPSEKKTPLSRRLPFRSDMLGD